MGHHDHHENPDIRYEGRDIDNRSVSIMGLIVVSVLFVISLAMIPFCQYMWNWAQQTAPSAAEGTLAPLDAGRQVDAAPKRESPQILVEVMPGSELHKFKTEMTAAQADQKIEKAMREALDEGFSYKK